MPTFQTAFISYGRADSKAFAAKLNDRLMAAGFTVWFDFEDIPLGVDYQKQIDDGIEKADNFLFLISPHSVNSPYCGLEVELALKRGKRIIPLLHVEQISRDTWQERNPGGTDEQWAEYQAAGKHSSFANMHPAISKINWVYFREGIDDFEAGFQGLLDIFARQQEYVRQHTELLAAALTWEHHQKRTQYLLTGQARQSAEDWLHIRFQDEQPPCIPTDLHCEYITESIKNAHNLMTQVFLAHAETDAEVMQQIRRRLQREGMTVWTSATDICTGEDFQQAIRRGIEQADNLVYLLSPAALASEFCQQELDYALSLHKRIIPVLVRETDAATMPAALQGLQYIEWLAPEEKAAIADRPLLKALKDDAAYFNEHKVLLTQALKWERQQRNPSVLLRGYNLRHAEAWFKVAQTRARHQPTNLQTEFLQESLRQPPAPSLDVFISYSRVDSDFARQLNDRLQMQGKLTWFDQESIASGADFQQEIYRGIETSDHFLFILSPEAVNSPYCADEVEYAQTLHKRIVTVLYRPIDTSDLHPVLAAVQWIDFRKHDGDFNANFRRLLRTLETDRAHLEAHTLLLVRALEWEKKKQSKDLLLRGKELETVIEWLTQNAEKEPRSTQLQRDYINASRLEASAQQQAKLEQEARVRKRVTCALVAAVCGLVVAVGLGAAAFQQFRRAETQRQEAVQAEIDALVSSANALLDSEQPLDALIESLRAANQFHALDDQAFEMNYQVVGILHRAIAGTHEINRLSDHSHWVHAVAFSPLGDVFATAGRDGAVRIWHKQDKLISTIEGRQGDRTSALNFSPDGKTLAIAVNNIVKLINLEGNNVDYLSGHSSRIIQVNFSADGQSLVTAAADGTIGLWNRKGRLLQLIQGHAGPATDVQFTPNERTLVSSGTDALIKLWTEEGKLIKTFRSHAGMVSSLAFSPDYSTLASASFDGTIKLWNLSGDLLKTFEIEKDNILTRVRFHPDGQALVIATGERNTFRTSVKLWDIEGKERQSFEGHGSRITDAAFSPDDEFIVSTSFDGTVRLWDPDAGEVVTSVKEHVDRITDLSLSSNGQILASSSQDGSIALWDSERQFIETLGEHSEAVNAIAFNSNEDALFSASDDKTVKVWTRDGKLQNTLEGHTAGIKSLSVSPDGKLWVSVSEDGNVKLWTSQGELLKELTVDEGYADIVRFHPEDSLIAFAVGQFNQINRNVLLWDWQNETVIALNPIGQFAVSDMRFSPTGDSLAVASWHGNVSFWNLAGAKLNSFFAGHAGPINAMRFSPDGSALAVGSQSLMLFSLQGDLQQRLELPEQGEISSLVFSPEGREIITGQMDGSILTWNMDASELVQKGCQRLEDYLVSHPETLVELRLCQTPARLAQAANTLIKRGESLALQGNKREAIEVFEQALDLNPQADLVPEEMAASLASRGSVSRLIEEGDSLARQGDRAAALEKYKAATALDSTLTFDAETRVQQEEVMGIVEQLVEEGRDLARKGNVEAAKARFQAAKDQEPNLALDPDQQARYFAADKQFTQAETALSKGNISEAITAITQVQQLAPNLLTRSPQFLSDLCRQGSIEGEAESVIKICDEAVSLASDQTAMRDSRGLARALTGDTTGAISDFQFFVDNTENEVDKQQRQQWIQQLTAGQNPFTPEVLEGL